MILRRAASMLLLILVLPLGGCSKLLSFQIVPGPGVQTLSRPGQTAQFKALVTNQLESETPTTSDVTRSVKWSVSTPSVATIDSTGLVTAVGAGNTAILAQYKGVIASSDVTVTNTSGSQGVPAITVIPGSGAAVTTFVGETTHFLAIGSLNGSGTTQDLTKSVQWVSSDPSVATVDQNGVATTVGANASANTTTITAIGTTTDGGAVTGTSTLTTNLSSGSVNQPTLTVIPSGGAETTFQGETTQFIAIGNLGAGAATQDLTNKVRWVSSDVSVATIDQSGLATGINANKNTDTTTITAIGATTAGSIITATSTLTSIPAGGPVNLPTLTLYKVGLGTGAVSSSPSGLSCGAQASCTGNFTLNSTVTLTATPDTGSSFAGWSGNCTPVVGAPLDPLTNVPTQCSLKMTNNDTVGAIFNKP